MTDSDFLIKEWRDTLTQFKNDYDKWEKHTLKDYLNRCSEIIRNQIESKVIDLKMSGISSYLYSQLDKEGIEVSQRYIQIILPEEYKQNYNKSEITSQLEADLWTPIETSDGVTNLEKNQYNEFKINGKEVRPRVEKKEVIQDDKEPTFDKTTRQFVYLSAMSKLANKFHLTFETLKSRYNESDEIQFLIDKELGNVEKKLEQYAKDWANIENSKGMIDLRRDYGEYEKIMARFMMETGETIARISQIMDYSEKYGSIGILREPKVMEFFETEDTYPLYLRSCPKCNCDISQVMNGNISLYREQKELNIKIPVIKYTKQAD